MYDFFRQGRGQGSVWGKHEAPPDPKKFRLKKKHTSNENIGKNSTFPPCILGISALCYEQSRGMNFYFNRDFLGKGVVVGVNPRDTISA